MKWKQEPDAPSYLEHGALYLDYFPIVLEEDFFDLQEHGYALEVLIGNPAYWLPNCFGGMIARVAIATLFAGACWFTLFALGTELPPVTTLFARVAIAFLFVGFIYYYFGMQTFQLLKFS